MTIKSYEDLDVYKLAFSLALRVHKLAEPLPKVEQYGGLADQIRRSSKGICANLAEGLSKHMSLADERKFLSIALGSAEETRVWLSFMEKLEYLEKETVVELREEYSRVCQMIFGLLEKRRG
ncbi:MAG: four helix bundle protein [Proteobacteria bacterium]|nr:four helix bundle protein [Pseudomonadota bacterium]